MSLAALCGEARAVLKEFLQMAVENIDPKKGDLQTKLVAVIDAYSVSFDNPITGSYIEKPNAAMQAVIANLLIESSATVGLPLVFLAGCMAQESMFCPVAWNKNLKGANPTGSFAGTDWGICQINGANLPSQPGMEGLTDAQMQAKACDPAWAIPVFAKWYKTLYDWANVRISEYRTTKNPPNPFAGASEAVLARAVNPYWLATLAYNRGMTGALLEVTGKAALVAHPDQVSAKSNHIASLLDLPAVMPSVA